LFGLIGGNTLSTVSGSVLMSATGSSTSGSIVQKPCFVGIDVGGTNIKAGLIDFNGRTLAYHSMPTDQQKGAENACRRIGELYPKLVKEAGVGASDVLRAGLATPGPIDIRAGMILRPGNLPGWWDFPIRDRLSNHLGLPVTFANDANAAAYGEYWRGAGTNVHSMVLLTLGTGVGGGIIVGDTLIEGAHSCGSECGHILVNPADDAPQDSLGNRGSLESYANASALVARTVAVLKKGVKSSLAKNYAAGETITPRVIAAAAEQGDEIAGRAIMETAYWLAIGIVTLVHTIDPDAVVLGGAMTFGGRNSPLGRDFLQRIRDEVRPRLLEPLRNKLSIEFATLGGDAGYIGAAGLARLDERRQRSVSVSDAS
jgi:glucokinase